MLRRPLLVLALLSFAVLPPLRAQEGGVPVGSRIRVLTRDAGPVAGVFLGLRADTLLLATGDGVALRRPTGDLLGIEASRGTRSAAGTGAVVGLVIGAVGGGLGAGATCAATYDCPVDLAMLVGAAVAGVLGAGLGAGLGASVRRESWRPVRVEELAGAGGGTTR